MTYRNRLLFAYLTAILVPATLMTIAIGSYITDLTLSSLSPEVLGGFLMIFAVTAVVTGLHATVLGLPLLISLDRHNQMKAWVCALSGAAVASAPTTFLMLALGAGWSAAIVGPVLAVVGAIGGLAAWSVWRLTQKPSPPQNAF